MKFREKMESFGIDAIVNVKDMDRARKLLADAGMPVEKLTSEISEEQEQILDASFSKARAKKTKSKEESLVVKKTQVKSDKEDDKTVHDYPAYDERIEFFPCHYHLTDRVAHSNVICDHGKNNEFL